MKRKILNLLLTVLMAVAAFSMNSEAAETEEITIVEEIISCTNAATFAAAEEEIEVVDAGYCGASSTMWGITEDGILLIVGEGWMPDWTANTVPWALYRNYIVGVVVSDTVNMIGAYSFSHCPYLKEVYIGEGVKKINDFAFSECSNIEKIELPNTITSIGKGVFANCFYLDNVELPNTLTSISPLLFSGCYHMENVVIPDTVEYIGNNAFENCGSLKTLKLPSGVTEIGAEAFYNCDAIEKISIPNTVMTIGNSVFWGCGKLKEVDLPDYITVIPTEMFYQCDNLTTITIPSQVTEIGYRAFSSCDNLATIRIPVNVQWIREGAFANCYELHKISIINENVNFGDRVFDWCRNLLIRCIENSTAHTYAVENNHPYELIDISLVTEYFADVEYETWYVDYIQYVYDNGIMQGIGGELFAPYGKVTRAMVVETLYKLEERPEVEDYSEFEMLTDLDREDWWASSVAWALDKGVATGDTYFMTFNPEDPVTREQLATFLYRYAKYKGLDTSAQDSLSGLLNAENVNEWAEDAVKWVVGEELITGVEILDEVTKEVIALDLAPQGNATRAQLATILTRFCGKYNN